MKKLYIIFLFLFFVFLSTVYAATVTLEWDASSSGDTAGYKLYYKISETGGAPYDGSGLDQGDSPIDVGDVLTYDLTGCTLSDRLYFVATAYDAGDDLYSWSEVSENPPDDSTGVLSCSDCEFVVDALIEYEVVITSGTANTYRYTIDDNEATTIECTGDNLYSDGVRSEDTFLIHSTVNESSYSNEVYTIYCGDNVCDAGECIAGCTGDCSVVDCCGIEGCNVAIGETTVNCPGDCSEDPPPVESGAPGLSSVGYSGIGIN